MRENKVIAEITFDEESTNGFRVELSAPEHVHCLSGCESIIKALLADREKNEDPLDARIIVSYVKSECPVCHRTSIPPTYVYSVVKLPYE